jgi:polyphenol oxidase
VTLASSRRAGTREREQLIEVSDTHVPLFVNEQWSIKFPWLIQGTTGRGHGAPFDLGLSGQQPVGRTLSHWWHLRSALGATTMVLPRQVHGSALLTHDAIAGGIHLSGPADGHISRTPAQVLAVTVADCVPVSIVEPDNRVVALLHAGWRGTAAGILEAGISAVCQHAGVEPHRLWAHFGPAICGACYEVGPEVHSALGLSTPHQKSPVDLRAVLAARAIEAGLQATAVSHSIWCTRCDASCFFSYRAGDAERQVGLLGVRGSS